jgi:serine/threonine-protein phosphatase 6 regulatory ankyrin repeat subunit B
MFKFLFLFLLCCLSLSLLSGCGGAPTLTPAEQANGGALSLTLPPEDVAVLEPVDICPFVSEYRDIFEAAGSGTVQDVKYFIEKGEDVNSTCDEIDNACGITPLHYAVSNNVDVVKYLIEQGANVNAKTTDGGSTPLSWMGYANSDHVKNVSKLLIENGADTKSLLYWAIDRHCSTEMLKYFIEQGADIKGDKNIFWKFIVTKRSIEDLKYMIELGADVNEKGDYGTPLLEAIWYIETMKFLLEQGADVNLTDNSGWTPLHKSAWFSQVEPVKLLIEKGADVNVKNNEGETPLDLAGGYRDTAQTKEEVVTLLQAAGGKSGKNL